MIQDGRPSDWCKGKAVFENSKSRPSKIPVRHPSTKGYPPERRESTTPSYTATYHITQKHPATLKKNFLLRVKNEPVLVDEVTSTSHDAK